MKMITLLILGLGLTAAKAVTIDAIYFGQTHVLKPDNPYFGLVGERNTLIKAHVTDPSTPASPAVSATLSLNGQTLILPLTGPATLPAAIPDGLGVVQHSYANTFTATMPAAWVKKGLQVTINAGSATSTVADMKVSAPTKVIMTMFDVQYFADTNGDYPSGTLAELEAKWPVSDLELRRLGHVVFRELVIPPREDVGSKAARIRSKAEYTAQTGLAFDGEQSAALEWNGALKRAAGRSGRWSLYYLNVYNAFAGGQAGGFAGVGSGTSLGILHHELGHALSLPHWGDSAAYPYKGDLHGIQAPANYNGTHSGPAWAFDLRTGVFIKPTVQAGNVGGKPVGTYKVDPMQGGGTGYQEPAYLMNHFSDYSINQMRSYLNSHVVIWNAALNSYAQWNQTAGAYTTTVSNNGVQFPVQRDVPVISVLASLSGANPAVNMVYPPLGPYTAGLIRLFDPTVAADRTAAQSIFSPANGSDYCVRVVQGGVTKTYMLGASALTSLTPLDEASLETEAINVPAAGGAVTKIELLSTPNVEDAGLPANPTILSTWAPLMPEAAAFDLAPEANGPSAVTMTAVTGELSHGFSGTVEYLFTETSGNPGGTTSAWQTSRSYTDTGLQTDTTYSYTVAMRAGAVTGTPSVPFPATTSASIPGGPITINATQPFALQSGNGTKTVTGLGTFNAAGADKLVVAVALENSNNEPAAVFSVRYNGVPMLPAVQQTGGNNDGVVALYYLDDPGPVGTGISISGYNPNGGLGTAYALTNTAPGFGAFNSRTGNAATSLPLTTSAANSLVIAALQNSGNTGSAGTPTANAPLVQASSGVWGSAWGSHASGSQLLTAPTTITPSFTSPSGGSFSLNIAAIEILAETVAANTWAQTAGNSQSWTTAGNWADGIVPNPTAGANMDFSNVDLLADTSLTLGADRTARLWKFGDTTGAQTWNVKAGNILTLAGTTPTFEIRNNITWIEAPIAGSSGLNKTGSGRLVLTGNNTYAGGTTVSAGTLQIGNGSTVGAFPLGNVVNNGTLLFDRSGTLEVPNIIGGSGALTIDCPIGTGTVVLSGANTFTGSINLTSGALRITRSASLGTGTKSVKINTGPTGNPQLLLDGTSGPITVPASISYLTSNESNGAIINVAGNNTLAGAITLTGGGGNTRIQSNAGTLTLSGPINTNFAARLLRLRGTANGFVTGPISNGSTSNVIALSKEDSGTWTLAGINTYTGSTSISGGTLVLGADNVLPPTAINLGAAILNASTFANNMGPLDLTGSATIQLGNAAAISFADSSAIDWSGGTLSISGNLISGSSIRFGNNSTALNATQLAQISAPGFTGFTLNTTGYLVANTASTFAQWQAANNTIGTLPQDHDNDGVTNGIEYFLGGTTSTAGPSALPGIVKNNGILIVSWLKSSSYPGIYGTHYQVESSSNLTGPWTPETNGANVAIVGDNITYTFPAASLRRFIRLKVSGP